MASGETIPRSLIDGGGHEKSLLAFKLEIANVLCVLWVGALFWRTTMLAGELGILFVKYCYADLALDLFGPTPRDGAVPIQFIPTISSGDVRCQFYLQFLQLPSLLISSPVSNRNGVEALD